MEGENMEKLKPSEWGVPKQIVFENFTLEIDDEMGIMLFTALHQDLIAKGYHNVASFSQIPSVDHFAAISSVLEYVLVEIRAKFGPEPVGKDEMIIPTKLFGEFGGYAKFLLDMTKLLTSDNIEKDLADLLPQNPHYRELFQKMRDVDTLTMYQFYKDNVDIIVKIVGHYGSELTKEQILKRLETAEKEARNERETV